jgi:FixJ family two-component response regulator
LVPALRTYEHFDSAPAGNASLEEREALPPSGAASRYFTVWMDKHVRTIAVVEDDPSMLRGLNRLLSAHGFRVERFASAESFLDDIARSEAKCLVVDIHLGGISGFDLKRRLTSSGRNLPVIFMTAIDSEVTRQEALDVGCIAYLSKPFLAKLLIDAINGVA